MTNPEQLIANFEAKMAESRRKAQQMVTEIEAVSVTERSKDGQISVEVNHAGNLIGLEIGQVGRDKPGLAEEILRTVKSAQSKLAAAMRTGVTSPVGPETMDQLVTQLQHTFPQPEPEGFTPAAPEPDDDRRLFAEDDHEAVPPRPPAPPAPNPPTPPAAPPRAVRRRADDGTDDDYFSDGDYLR